MWQRLSEELYPLVIVTVALDSNPATALPYIEKAKPTHPSLIDASHVVDKLFGIVNVPSGVWIDEHGRVARPAEPAWPRRPDWMDTTTVPEVKALNIEADRYISALREWVKSGRHALYPEPPPSSEEAARNFEQALEFHRAGNSESAHHHFQEAIRLQPANWTYKRQAWKFGVKGDWLTEVRKIGPENYYPRLLL